MPVPKARKQRGGGIADELELPKADPKPTAAATAGKRTTRRPKLAPPAPTPAAAPRPDDRRKPAAGVTGATVDAAAATPPIEKERLADPARRNVLSFGGAQASSPRRSPSSPRARA